MLQVCDHAQAGDALAVGLESAANERATLSLNWLNTSKLLHRYLYLFPMLSKLCYNIEGLYTCVALDIWR